MQLKDGRIFPSEYMYWLPIGRLNLLSVQNPENLFKLIFVFPGFVHIKSASCAFCDFLIIKTNHYRKKDWCEQFRK